MNGSQWRRNLWFLLYYAIQTYQSSSASTGATTLSIMAFSIMTLSVMRFSMTTFSVMTFSIRINKTRHSIMEEHCHAECYICWLSLMLSPSCRVLLSWMSWHHFHRWANSKYLYLHWRFWKDRKPSIEIAKSPDSHCMCKWDFRSIRCMLDLVLLLLCATTHVEGESNFCNSRMERSIIICTPRL
jgi:hypothetical protein